MRDLAGAFGEPATFLSGLVAEGVDIIYLRRRNLLMHAVSMAEAERSRYHWRTGDSLGFQPLSVEPAEILGYLSWLGEDDKTAARAVAPLPFVSLTYEDDLATVAAQQATVDLVLGRFGLPSVAAHSDLVRISPRTIRERVLNFDELAEALDGTEYKAMLDEPS